MTNIEEAMKKQAELRRRQAEEAAPTGADAQAEAPPGPRAAPKPQAPPAPAEPSAAVAELHADVAIEPIVQTELAVKPATTYEPASATSARIDERIVSFHHPESQASENFKQFHTLLRTLSEESTATVAFASATRGEGRTTAAVNFAVALAADAPGSVCIVDADLRHPGVHKALGMRPPLGLADVLGKDIPLDTAIVPTAVPRLSLLAAGNSGGSPSELLRSLRLGKVIDELRERFDYTVFDTAPVLPVADTILLASHMDGLVMVVRAGKTKRKHVVRAMELLGHASMMGFVLNQANESIR